MAEAEAAEAIETAPRIFLVAKQTHDRWLQLCNEHRRKHKKKPFKKTKIFQYNVGIVLKHKNIRREVFYSAVQKYKEKHGEDGWLELCRQSGLHKSYANSIKKKL